MNSSSKFFVLVVAVLNRLAAALCIALAMLYSSLTPAPALAQNPKRPAFAISNGGDANHVGIAVGDLNGDLVPDMLVANQGYLELSYGNGDGRFQAPISRRGCDNGIEIGQLNTTGFNDIVETCHIASNFLNEPTIDGVLLMPEAATSIFSVPDSLSLAPRVQYSTGAIPIALAIGDLDEDGIDDIVVSNFNVGTVSVLNSRVSFLKQDLSVTNPSSIALAKLTNSSHLDLIVLDHDSSGSTQVETFFGNGVGTFASTNSYPAPFATSLAVGDLNGDGFPDIVVGGVGGSQTLVLVNQQNESFQVHYESPVGLDLIGIADMNGDGYNDIVSSGWERGIVIVLNKGDGTFPDPGTAFPEVAIDSGPYPTDACQPGNLCNLHHFRTGQARIADIDSDGRPDIVADGGILINKTGDSPTITSPATVQLAECEQGGFLVTTDITASVNIGGTLPDGRSGLPDGLSSFPISNGAALSGVPSQDTNGQYQLTATASTWVPPDASQKLALTITGPNPHSVNFCSIGTPITVPNTNNQVTINFLGGITSSGDIYATPTNQPSPLGFTILGQSYDITTTASVNPPVEVCFTGTFDGSEVIYHGGNPVDTYFPSAPPFPTTQACAHVDSLSPFFVARPIGSDMTPPVLTLPGSITVEASGPGGSAASFTAGAIDDVDGVVPVSCIPPSGSTFSLGTTPVNCSASDQAGNTATGSFNITVRDTTKPVLTLPANITTEATGPATVVTYTVTANDTVNGTIMPSCSPASGATFGIGTTPVNCSASDTSGNTATGNFMVTVQDITAPTLTVPANITAEATSAQGATVTYTVTANDTVNGAITPTCSPTSGGIFPLGMTTVTCSASDAAGNTGTGSFTITIRDTSAPTITVPANITAEATGPATVVTYIVTANDSVNGAITPACLPASGATFPLGMTTVNCSATDAAGNTSKKSFAITLRDTTGPSITVPSNLTLSATGPGGAVVIYSASATDLVSGPVTPMCLPPSGSTFAVGTTTVSCSATDGAGNVSTRSFTVTVTSSSTTEPPMSVLSAALAVTHFSPPNSDLLGATLLVQLGAHNDGVNLGADLFHFAVVGGTVALTVDIPLASFKRHSDGSLAFSGTVSGLPTNVAIKPGSGGKYGIVLGIAKANLGGFTNPAIIQISLGDDVGSATTNAVILKK